MPKKKAKKQTIIGWREWVSFPDLGVERIKAKIDTGARTSSIHAFQVHEFSDRGAPHVEFVVHPRQRRRQPEIICHAPIIDKRLITSSTGDRQERCVILTPVLFGDTIWPIELTLANRDVMGFRLLIGRQALRGRFLIDPGTSFRLNRRPRPKRETE